jgi:hypothetical protein
MSEQLQERVDLAVNVTHHVDGAREEGLNERNHGSDEESLKRRV